MSSDALPQPRASPPPFSDIDDCSRVSYSHVSVNNDVYDMTQVSPFHGKSPRDTVIAVCVPFGTENRLHHRLASVERATAKFPGRIPAPEDPARSSRRARGTRLFKDALTVSQSPRAAAHAGVPLLRERGLSNRRSGEARCRQLSAVRGERAE